MKWFIKDAVAVAVLLAAILTVVLVPIYLAIRYECGAIAEFRETRMAGFTCFTKDKHGDWIPMYNLGEISVK